MRTPNRLRYRTAPIPEGDGTGGQMPAPQGGGSGYTPPATQDDFDRIIGERVARERAKYSDYEDLKAQSKELADLKAQGMTEAQRTAVELENARATVAAKDVELATKSALVMKYQVAAEVGMDLRLAERLQGTTVEELRADAAELTQLTPPQGPATPPPANATAPLPGQGPRPVPPSGGIEEGREIAQRRFGKTTTT